MFATLLIAMDLTGSLAVADRTEVRARVAPSTAAAIDVDSALAARLSLSSRRLRCTLGYTPRLTVWGANIKGAQPSLFHGGDARVEWLGRHAVLSLSETASYGATNLASSPPAQSADGQPPRVEVVPVPRLLHFVSSTTTLALALSLRRWVVGAQVGYDVAGGASAEARSILPERRGPFGEVTADYAASRRDHAVFSLSASEVTLSPGPTVVLADSTLGYRRLLSRTTEARLSLGTSTVYARPEESSAQTFQTYPVAEAILTRRAAAGGNLDARIQVRVGPTVNRLTGFVDERLSGLLGATHRTGRLTTSAFVGASQSVPTRGPNAVSLFTGELAVAYGATDVVAFDAGLRGLWQHQEAIPDNISQGTMFVGVTLKAPAMRW